MSASNIQPMADPYGTAAELVRLRAEVKLMRGVAHAARAWRRVRAGPWWLWPVADEALQAAVGLLDAEPSDPDPAERWNPLEDRCDDPSCLICNPLVANSGKPLDGSVDLGEVPER